MPSSKKSASKKPSKKKSSEKKKSSDADGPPKSKYLDAIYSNWIDFKPSQKKSVARCSGSLHDGDVSSKELNSYLKKRYYKSTGQEPPKKEPSAYINFCQEERELVKRERVKNELPDLTFEQMGIELGARWRNLPQKEKDDYAPLASIRRASKKKSAKKTRADSPHPSPSPPGSPPASFVPTRLTDPMYNILSQKEWNPSNEQTKKTSSKKQTQKTSSKKHKRRLLFLLLPVPGGPLGYANEK